MPDNREIVLTQEQSDAQNEEIHEADSLDSLFWSEEGKPLLPTNIDEILTIFLTTIDALSTRSVNRVRYPINKTYNEEELRLYHFIGNRRSSCARVSSRRMR